jgi:predicted RND superfamily exporter protein
LVLATGFFIYLFSTMDNLFYFGLLTGFTISMAFVACVVMAPALMVLFVRAQRFAVAATQAKEVFE